MHRVSSFALASRATLLVTCALAAYATPASAQRCVAPTDSDDRPAEHRYCGTSLVTGLGGVAGFGNPATAGQGCLARNDDGSSPSLSLTPYFPAGLNFFGTTHTSAFLNTNGNITFSAALSTFTPSAFPVAARPMIAPFWADVDIRRYPVSGSCMGSVGVTCNPCTPCHNPDENGVWWHFSDGRAVFTWDRVGYYNCLNDRRMSFQLILTAAPGCSGEGDFDVEFRYNRCEWDTGGASGGSGGFQSGTGGQAAQAGFDAGNSRDFVEIEGSRVTREIVRRLCNDSNVGDPGVWRYQIRSGSIMCPEAGMPCSTGLDGVCGEGRTSCDCSGASCTTSCVPQVSASTERCNGLDDDCDGEVDEGSGLCDGAQICDRGVCVDPCFEGGCGGDQVCITGGLCVDLGCETRECPDGQVCIAGSCVGACDGVVCPAGLACRGGRCVDSCASIGCDDCTACVDGACVTRCDRGAPCPSGESCDADGRCVDDACFGRVCPDGSFCRAGTCVDACEGTTCPRGQMCAMGACVAIERPDGGPATRPDAGPVAPGADGGPPTQDGGLDGGVDAGLRGPPPRTGVGCTCRASGGAPGIGALLLALALGLVLRARRRRR